jgi:hypothetical protein
LLLVQIKAVKGERDALLTTDHAVTPAPAAMLLDLKGIGPEFAAVQWAEGLMQAWCRHPGRADLSIANKASPKLVSYFVCLDA